jgi:hypothetical protein
MKHSTRVSLIHAIFDAIDRSTPPIEPVLRVRPLMLARARASAATLKSTAR